jgi:hypothetical protein
VWQKLVGGDAPTAAGARFKAAPDHRVIFQVYIGTHGKELVDEAQPAESRRDMERIPAFLR